MIFHVLQKAGTDYADTITVQLKSGSIEGDFCWNQRIAYFNFGFYSSNRLASLLVGDSLLAYAPSRFVFKQGKEVLTVYNTDSKDSDADENKIEFGKLTVDVTIESDHYGCCYHTTLTPNKPLIYGIQNDVALSQCNRDPQGNNGHVGNDLTFFSFDMQCKQLKSLIPENNFKYIGHGGCRDSHSLSPARYWHDKLEFHTCQLACMTDDTCMGIMYFHNGKFDGRYAIHSVC